MYHYWVSKKNAGQHYDGNMNKWLECIRDTWCYYFPETTTELRFDIWADDAARARGAVEDALQLIPWINQVLGGELWAGGTLCYKDGKQLLKPTETRSGQWLLSWVPERCTTELKQKRKPPCIKWHINPMAVFR